MAENKTQPTDADVAAYLDSVTPEKRREDGLALDSIFREVTGEEPVMWGPSIVGYGRYHYRSPVNPRNHGEWPATGFSPRKSQLSLYGLKDLPEGAKLLPQLGKVHRGGRVRLCAEFGEHRRGGAAQTHRDRRSPSRRSRTGQLRARMISGTCSDAQPLLALMD